MFGIQIVTGLYKSVIQISTVQFTVNTFISLFRHDQRRGLEPGGARVSHAESSRLPARPLRDHAGVLAQGPNETAHVRDPAVAA